MRKTISVEKGLELLKQSDLFLGVLGAANRLIVTEHDDSINIVGALLTLTEHQLLSLPVAQMNFDLLVKHRNTEAARAAIESLSCADLLTGNSGQAHYAAVLAHENPFDVACALLALKQKGLLAANLLPAVVEANWATVTQHQTNPKAVAEALIVLHQAGLLSGKSAAANRSMLVQHQKNPLVLAEILLILHQAGLFALDVPEALVEDIRATLMRHRFPAGFAFALKILSGKGLLSGVAAWANFYKIANHQDPFSLGQVFLVLERAGLCSEAIARANFEVIVRHGDPEALSEALLMLQQTDLWLWGPAKTELEALLAHSKPLEFARVLLRLKEEAGFALDLAESGMPANSYQNGALSF